MDDRMIATLKKRAQRYAAPPEQKRVDTSIGSYVGVRIRELVFGLPSELVLECASLSHWTPFPGRRCLLGITHLRGDVMSLMDLLEAVTGQKSGKRSLMSILQGTGGRFAIPVAEIAGIRIVEMNELLPPGQSTITSPLITAVTRDLWFLLSEQTLSSLAETPESAGPSESQSGANA